jgi:hypothetical protein
MLAKVALMINCYNIKVRLMMYSISVPDTLFEKRKIIIQDLDSMGKVIDSIKLDEDGIKATITALSALNRQVYIAKKKWLKGFSEEQIKVINDLMSRDGFFYLDEYRARWFEFFFSYYSIEEAIFITQTFQYIEQKNMLFLDEEESHRYYKKLFSMHPIKMLSYAASISTCIKHLSMKNNEALCSFKNDIHPEYGNKLLSFREAIKFIELHTGIYYLVNSNGEKIYDYIDRPKGKEIVFQNKKNGNLVLFLSFSEWKIYKATEFLIESYHE